jgi:hypothetical protein
MTDRLAELEAQAARLASEIAALRATQPAAPPRPPKDEGVRVVPILTERQDSLPDLKQMQRLFSTVKVHSPWPQTLVNRFDENKPFRAFGSAFRWLQNVGRAPQPNGKVALSYWTDTCRLWLRARNCVGSDLDANSLVLAAFACGDVCYTPADAIRGWTWELALVEYGGKPATDAWRQVLSSGAILPPSAPARRMAPPSPARVIVGGY